MKTKLTPLAIGIGLSLALGLASGPTATADDLASKTTILRIAPAKLHIKSVKITKSVCGQPLEFTIEVTNSGGPFKGPAWVYIKGAGNEIGHSFKNVAGGSTYTDIQASAALSADCCKPECYRVFITANEGATGDVPEWDHIAMEVCTKPVCRLEVVTRPLR